MKGKSTLLAALLEKMSAENRTQIVKDLNEFIRSHPDNASNIEVDSLLTYHGLERSPEEIEAERSTERFSDASKKFGQSGPGGNYNGVNVQEM